MKLSVSLPAEDVDFIDQYGEEHGVDSRSAVVHRAVSLLRASELSEDYEGAWTESANSDEGLWNTTDGDGLG